MKIICLGWIVALFLCPQSALFARSVPQSHTEKASENAASFAFEPLDRWKAAVLSGDKTELMGLYTTFPPARAKTSQGDTQDPTEEPAFWSSLRRQGLNRLNLKVLEAKTLQPGVMSLVLRIEAGFRTGEGERPTVISASQIWIQKLGEWRIIATQRSDVVDKPAMRLPEPARPNIDLYPDPKTAPAEIASALTAASRDHKRVLLVFGGNWCYDCHVLDATFHSRAIAPLVNGNYHVVHVNVGNYDANLDLARRYEIPLDKGVPSLAILSADGKLIISQKKGEFESTVRIGPEDVIEFLRKWKPPISR